MAVLIEELEDPSLSARLDAAEYAAIQMRLKPVKETLAIGLDEVDSVESAEYHECFLALCVLIEDPAYVLCSNGFSFPNDDSHSEVEETISFIIAQALVLTKDRYLQACHIMLSWAEKKQDEELTDFEEEYGHSIIIEDVEFFKIGNYNESD